MSPMWACGLSVFFRPALSLERVKAFASLPGENAAVAPTAGRAKIFHARRKHTINGTKLAKEDQISFSRGISLLYPPSLKGLTDLGSLNLANTKVTDAGLKHLKGLTKLQEVDLMLTQVTRCKA